MFKKLFNEHTYPYWGLAALFIIILGCIITALLYPLGGGEHYSLLNYFISELGDLKHLIWARGIQYMSCDWWIKLFYLS